MSDIKENLADVDWLLTFFDPAKEKGKSESDVRDQKRA
jgi:hypothetical protein